MPPHASDTIQITVRLTREMLAFIDDRMKARGSFVTRADVIREMLGLARTTLESATHGSEIEPWWVKGKAK